MKGLASRIESKVADAMAQHSFTPSPFDCQTAFKAIAKRCTHLIRKHRKTAIEADPDAIHTMRIELTRLRALVLFFSPMVDDDAWPEINKELHWLNSALGKARDHDVIASYIRRKRYRGWASSSRRAMQRAQSKVDRRLSKKLSSARNDRLMRRVEHWITHGPWLQNDWSLRSTRVDGYADPRLRVWRTGIWRQGRHLRALHRKKLHHLRIRCKQYRYVVATLLGMGVSIAKQELKFSETTRSAHKALGDLRDDLKRLRRATQGRPPGYRKTKRQLLQRAEKLFRREL